jgi:hemerythrin-like metal-binding protein
MAQLEWSDALSLDLPFMDDVHHEFVNLLAQVQVSSDSLLPMSWQRLIDHTDTHFGHEDRWMRATHFASTNCHSMQHKVVLQVMREGVVQAAMGDLASVRYMASELALWFPNHAQTMDAALALHLRQTGFDPMTGVVSSPDNLPAQHIHGCGGAACTEVVTTTN